MRHFLAIVAIALPLVIYGQEQPVKEKRVDRGNGVIKADGNGIVILKGSGNVNFEGECSIWYKGDGELKLEPAPAPDQITSSSGDGWRFISCFKGKGSVSENKIHLALSGKVTKLEASGKGRVFLWGKGSYSADGIEGRWTPEHRKPILYGKLLKEE
ncbi:MAG: hypothetical protein HY769_09600 [Candidatus Stahlbacteria bacterium]|nr:hypothetical protein [Candidatus Stahlbacteria bacterium]